MPRPRLRCPHCGEIDWSRAPEMFITLQFVERRHEMTSRDIADTLGLSIANASNRMRALEEMEFVTRTTRVMPTGGTEGVFSATQLGRDALNTSPGRRFPHPTSRVSPDE